MPKHWQIACFIDAKGNNPVSAYMFDEKNLTDLEVMINVIQRLSHVGQDLIDTNMAKHIDGPIFELRKDRHRIMYAEDSINNRFVLLSAFLKETQKTPPKEMEKAYRHWKEYSRTGKCQIFRLPYED